MKLIHIVGRQNNGKTTLIVELVKELNKMGIRVGTIKHSGHEHELDKPGKDSFLHRDAGGNPAAVVTKNLMAVYLPRQNDEDPIKELAPVFKDRELILIEGYINGPGKKIEVFREEIGTAPLFSEREDIEAVVTDNTVDTSLPVLPRKDVKNVVQFICSLAELKGHEGK